MQADDKRQQCPLQSAEGCRGLTAAVLYLPWWEGKQQYIILAAPYLFAW